jgi:hypothetical protein
MPIDSTARQAHAELAAGTDKSSANQKCCAGNLPFRGQTERPKSLLHNNRKVAGATVFAAQQRKSATSESAVRQTSSKERSFVKNRSQKTAGESH